MKMKTTNNLKTERRPFNEIGNSVILEANFQIFKFKKFEKKNGTVKTFFLKKGKPSCESRMVIK